MQKVRVMEGIEKERADIKVREEEIQGLLKEAGERYEELRAKFEGVPASAAAELGEKRNGMGAMGRGLESIGSAASTPAREVTPSYFMNTSMATKENGERNGFGNGVRDSDEMEEDEDEEEDIEMDIDERPRFGL